jgi:hypothetical protein
MFIFFIFKNLNTSQQYSICFYLYYYVKKINSITPLFIDSLVSAT